MLLLGGDVRPRVGSPLGWAPVGEPNHPRYRGGMVPRAQLRAFAPLESFPPRERERWSRYVDQGGGLTRRRLDEVEQRALRAHLVRGRRPVGPDAALVRRMGRRILVCPLELDLRAAYALASFRRDVPGPVVETALPHAPSTRHLDRLADSGRAPHILDEPWAVPLQWFVAFDPQERHVTEPTTASGPRVTHLTTCGQAASRLEQAMEAVDGVAGDGEDVLATLAGLRGWVGAFDPASVLELDYGRVAGLLPAEQLREDTTCRDLWEAIEALRTGDRLGAAAAYGQARARWTRWRAKQRAS